MTCWHTVTLSHKGLHHKRWVTEVQCWNHTNIHLLPKSHQDHICYPTTTSVTWDVSQITFPHHHGWHDFTWIRRSKFLTTTTPTTCECDIHQHHWCEFDRCNLDRLHKACPLAVQGLDVWKMIPFKPDPTCRYDGDSPPPYFNGCLCIYISQVSKPWPPLNGWSGPRDRPDGVMATTWLKTSKRPLFRVKIPSP
jgi:hypothetical protein